MAYSCIGTMLYGVIDQNFYDILRSSIKCLELLSGFSTLDKENLVFYDIIFYFSMIVNIMFSFYLKIIMFFILLRMFIAIFDGHFN